LSQGVQSLAEGGPLVTVHNTLIDNGKNRWKHPAQEFLNLTEKIGISAAHFAQERKKQQKEQRSKTNY